MAMEEAFQVLSFKQARQLVSGRGRHFPGSLAQLGSNEAQSERLVERLLVRSWNERAATPEGGSIQGKPLLLGVRRNLSEVLLAAGRLNQHRTRIHGCGC